MRYVVTVASAAIPAAVWAVWPSTARQPLVAKQVMTEGVREQRQDTETFRARWANMPPAMVVRYATSALTEPTTSTRRVEAPPTRVRRARLDLCQRHRMRKVHYGRTWRCRR